MGSPDSDLRRARRAEMVRAIDAELGPFDSAHLEALVAVPRERFVRTEDVMRAEVDAPLPLDDSGKATISAPHAYLMSYRALGLGAGDRLLELGSGTGYGAALASEIVGPRGVVMTIEIDDDLARAAHALLAPLANVIAIAGDAIAAAGFFAEYNKIVATFSVDPLPRAWLDSLAHSASLVAPVGTGTQRLVRAARDERGVLAMTEHGGVRYVPNRSP